MRKNAVYLLLLIALGIVAYYLFFREEGLGFETSETNFSVKDVREIEKILLTDLIGNKVILYKHDNEWLANDSVEITQRKVKDLLDALHHQQASQPVSIGSHDEVIKQMSSDNTKVEVYSKKGKTHVFYVGRKNAPNNLTYMLCEGAKRPYIVKLPLSNIFLGIRYSTNIDEWRSQKILRAKADEIEMISVVYSDSAQYSFSIKNEKGKTPIVTGSASIDKPLNLKRVNTYLGLWDSIYCLGFEARNKIKDTILTQGKVLATVSMKKINKPLQTLILYFKPISKGTKAVLKVGREEYDFDVFMGYLNRKDLIVVSRNYAQMMLRSYPEFFEEDIPPVSPSPNPK